jgi:pimeloyl-ACP methyl ester carboxylesterase
MGHDSANLIKEMLVTAGDITVFSESFGDRAAPPVLLIMGAMASGVWWPASFCAELAARGRFVIRYDHRDTGRSTSYPPGETRYSVEALADDALTILDAWGIAEAHLVGMSLGGYISQLLALKAPERVLSLTLIASERLALTDPSIPPMDPRVPAYHARAAELDWTDRPAVIEYQVGAWRLLSGSAHPFDEAHIRALCEEDLDRTSNPLSAFNHAGLNDATGWVDRLDEIRAPALIIHGTEDLVLPYAHGLALQRALSNSRLLTLEGSGHELHPLDWPVMIDAIVRHTEVAMQPSPGN